MASKTIILITGANQGLGWYAAQKLASTGKVHVLLGSRSEAKGAEAVARLVADTSTPVAAANVTPIQLDVSLDDSIIAAAKRIQAEFGHIDVLVNNAGIMGPQEGPVDGSDKSIRALYQTEFNTNVFGVAAVTEAFLPLLRASKHPDRRIVCVSSGIGSIGHATDPQSPYHASNFALPIYRSTKAALNMLVAAWAPTLQKDGISVTVLDPGYNATNITGYAGALHPSVGGAFIAKIAFEGSGKDHHGKFICEEGVAPW